MNIAVLDNDPAVLKHIGSILESAGHHVFLFGSSKQLFQHESIDLLILNWNSDGSDLMNQFTEKYSNALPILLMAARSYINDIAQALKSSTTDFILKPLRRAELLTRLQTLLQRAYPEQMSAQYWQCGPYVFDIQTAHVTLGGKSIELTRKEFDLAILLFRNLNRPLSRAYLLKTIWSQEPDVSSRTLDTHISRVRTKLQIDLAHDFELSSVYGYGYQLAHQCT